MEAVSWPRTPHQPRRSGQTGKAGPGPQGPARGWGRPSSGLPEILRLFLNVEGLVTIQSQLFPSYVFSPSIYSYS